MVKFNNFTGGNIGQLYITDPSKHKFLVKATTSASTFSNILGSVLGLFPGFWKRQNQTNNSKDVEDKEQAATEASTIKTNNTIHSGKSLEISNNVDAASEDNASDLGNFCTNESVHHDTHDAGFFPTKNIFPNHAHNEMLSHYNCIIIGCFKDIFQSVDTNNLAEVLQTLKELNFMLANRAPELAADYGMPLEPWQLSAKEVPDFVNAYLNKPTAYTIEHSSRGRPRTRGNQHYRYNRQSSIPKI